MKTSKHWRKITSQFQTKGDYFCQGGNWKEPPLVRLDSSLSVWREYSCYVLHCVHFNNLTTWGRWWTVSWGLPEEIWLVWGDDLAKDTEQEKQYYLKCPIFRAILIKSISPHWPWVKQQKLLSENISFSPSQYMVVLLLEMLMMGWVRWAGDGVVTVAFLTPVTKGNQWQDNQIQQLLHSLAQSL